jgi:hypothetical protein
MYLAGALAVPDPAEAANLLDATTIILLVLGVLAELAVVIWLGRELMASRLSVRMLAENQRLSQREQRYQRSLAKQRREPMPAPAKVRSGTMLRTPEPPPLPTSEPPDWSDSRLKTEVPLSDEAEMRAAELEERVLDPEAPTVEFPLIVGQKPTAVWPWRKLPPKPDN